MNNIIKERIEVLSKIKQIIVDYLHLDVEPDFIDDDASLFGTGLGLDSIDSLELVVGLEKEFDISIDSDSIEIFLSVNTIADYIISKLTKVKYSHDDSISRPASYVSLRENILVYKKEIRVITINENEASMNFISKVTSGNDIVLEPNRAIYTTLLNSDGSVIDFIYVMMFDGYYKIIFDGLNSSCLEYLQSECEKESIKISSISECYQVVIEGPYAWKVAKQLVGFELTGLGYLRFMNCVIDGNEYTVLRAGNTNEYCFRFFVLKKQLEVFISHVIDLCKEFDYYFEPDIKESNKLISLASREVRFPSLNNIYGNDLSPLENEIKWMVRLQKESFIGKDRIIEQMKHNKQKAVIFICLDNINIDSLKGSKVLFEGKEIGYILNVDYSYGLGKWFGYVMLSSDYAYSNCEYEVITNIGGDLIKILTVSSPLFLTKSSQIQME